MNFEELENISEIIVNEENEDEQTDNIDDYTNDAIIVENTNDTNQVFEQISMQIEEINENMTFLGNIQIVTMVGIGILIGVLACNIFAKYFKI